MTKMGKRNLYLKTVSVEEAQERFMEKLEPCLEVQYEEIEVVNSLHRITKEASIARYCSPLFNASAMDGIAVVSAHTLGASEKTPVALEEGRDYVVVDTGDPIHPPYDAVIMAEDIVETESGEYTILQAAAPWDNIRPIGEDIVTGEMILPSNHKIRPMDIGALLSAGILTIPVVKKPRVAIYPTGTEIIEPTETPGEGDIIESNSRVIENRVTEGGGIPHRFPAIPDDYEKIRETLVYAIQTHEMVIINAGSSAGREDYTVQVLRELGEVVVHGVAMKPGKPVILAIVQGKPVIGLPGYPVAAYMAYESFVVPVLNKLTGQVDTQGSRAKAVVSKRLVSSLKHREYVRVKLGVVKDKLVASPLARGAGAAMSMVKADGCLIIPQNSEGIGAGESAEVVLYKALTEIVQTLVVIGSHDLILDLIADRLPAIYQDEYLSSTHVGSMGGLMALKRGEAHMAPIHLLDEADGSYNVNVVKSLFKEPMALIQGVGRVQGLMVKPGNPLGIQGFEDLRAHRFVNRQRGAGTRLLLDYNLKKRGISPDSILGYSQELTTHMAVAAAVGSDGADVGMGVQSAAMAMGLDFIPVGEESYDFALPQENLEMPEVKHFIEILKSDALKEKLTALGGYAIEHSGEILHIDGRE